VSPAGGATAVPERSGAPSGRERAATTGERPAVAAVRPGTPVTVRTPATSANLGPGFDSLGLALALYDEVTVEATDDGHGDGVVEVVVEGEGAGAVPGDERHLVVRAIRAGLEYAGAGRPGLRLHCRNAIPHGRGLGSSASAVVSGLVAARGLLADPTPLDDATLLRLATALEGHPDNAAAALLGGFTISWTETGPGSLDEHPGSLDEHPGSLDEHPGSLDEHPGVTEPAAGRAGDPSAGDPSAGDPSAGDPSAGDPSAGDESVPVHLPWARAVTVPVHPDAWVVACVPDYELATSVARGMLPAAVAHRDAAFNAGRAALLVEALGRRPDLLLAATADRLHQGQRAPAMPGSARLVRTLRGAGAAAVVSGAGPTVLVLGAGTRARQTVREVLGELFGDVSGELFGDVSGELLGDVSGGPSGDVSGEVFGDASGGVSGGRAGPSSGDGLPGWRALSLLIDTVGARLITERTEIG
jgi:homoserine kinase